MKDGKLTIEEYRELKNPIDADPFRLQKQLSLLNEETTPFKDYISRHVPPSHGSCNHEPSWRLLPRTSINKLNANKKNQHSLYRLVTDQASAVLSWRLTNDGKRD